MSFHHENATWKSPKDGLWYHAFYTRIPGSGGEDYDPEWDDDFDFESFEWVSQGYPTADAAEQSWCGPNPGGRDMITTKAGAKECDRLARRYRDPEFARKDDLAQARKAFTALHKKIAAETDLTKLHPGVRIALTYGPPTYGIGYTARGPLRRDGDWLVLDTKSDLNPDKTYKVFNTKTGKFYHRGLEGLNRISFLRPLYPGQPVGQWR